MKQVIFCAVALLAAAVLRAQDITGEWYSADSTRIYKVWATADGYKGALLSSARSCDRPGATVLTEVIHRRCKDVYKGVLLAVSDSMPVVARLTFADKRRRVLRLRLRRMLVGRTTIWWYRR